jgi:hypothetical protein
MSNIAKCGHCDAKCPPNKPRIFITRWWLCSDCAYSYIEGRDVTPTPEPKPARVEQPSLFPIDTYVKTKGGSNRVKRTRPAARPSPTR